MARAAINIIGSDGSLYDVVTQGLGEITSRRVDVGHYEVQGTLGMVPFPPADVGWGFVLNQIDLAAQMDIEYVDHLLVIRCSRDGEPYDLQHMITLHVLVEDLPVPVIPEPAEPEPMTVEKAVAEYNRLRAAADFVIAPLQDAVDLGEATPEEEALLLAWKRYRVALNRISTQSGYPQVIQWPEPPTLS